MYTSRGKPEDAYRSIHQKRLEAKMKVQEKLNDSFGSGRIDALRGGKTERLATETGSVHSKAYSSIKQQILDVKSQLYPVGSLHDSCSPSKTIKNGLAQKQSKINDKLESLRGHLDNKSPKAEAPKSPILKFKEQYDALKKARLSYGDVSKATRTVPVSLPNEKNPEYVAPISRRMNHKLRNAKSVAIDLELSNAHPKQCITIKFVSTNYGA